MNLHEFTTDMLDAVQWYAMLTLSLTLFRLKPEQWRRQNTLLALALKAVTLALKATVVSPYLAIVQLALIALAFHLFYRIRLGYACIIAVTGGIIVFVSVMAVNYGLSAATNHTFAEMMFNKTGLSMYAASAAILTLWTFFLAWTLKRLRLGFSFVTASYRQPKPNMRLFGIPLTMFLALIVVLPPGDSGTYMPMLIVGVSVCLLMLLLASLRTELQDDPGGRFDPKAGD
jgi:hypothetical protein